MCAGRHGAGGARRLFPLRRVSAEHTRDVKSALAAVLLLAACAGDDAPVCEDTTAFGAPVVLAETFTNVELGSDDVLVFSTTYDAGNDETTLWARVHALDGAPLGEAAALSIDADLYAAGAVRGDGGWELLWPEAGELRRATLTADGGLGDPVRWADAGQAFVYMVARAGGGLAAVWSVNERLFLGIDGAVVELGRGQAPAIAAGDGELGLVWADVDRTVWFERVSLAAEVLGEPIAIGPLSDYLSPGICFDGEAYVIAYTVRPEGTVGDVHLTRIADGGASEPLRVSAGDGRSWAPSVACGDGTIGIAWQHNVGGTVPGTDLALSQIEFAAATADAISVTAQVPVDAVTDVQALIPRIAVAADGGYLVTWQDFGAAGYRTKLSSIDRCGF